MKFLRLIEAHKHAEILDYVKSCKCLASYEEMALIDRGNHEEIMSYIANHYFDCEGYCSLLKRGNLTEIRFYILNQGICYPDYEAELTPFLRNIANELVDYLLLLQEGSQKYDFMAKDEEHNRQIENYEILVIKSGDHCALRRYLTHLKKPLHQKALVLFNTQGYATAEDRLMYNLVCRA